MECAIVLDGLDSAEGWLDGPARPGQSPLEWFLVSTDASCVRGRKLLRKLLESFPADGGKRAWQYIAKGKRNQQQDRLFEIYLEVVLRRHGFIVERDVALPGGSVVDFRVSDDVGPMCYIEATVVHSDPTCLTEDEEIRDLFGRASSYSQCSGYMIELHKVVKGHQAPSPRVIASLIDEWVTHLKWPDTTSTAHGTAKQGPEERGPDTLNASEIVDARSGWRFYVSAIPLRAPELKPPDLIGVWHGGTDWIDMFAVRDAARAKLKQHTTADLPLIIAISVSDPLRRPSEDVMLHNLLGSLAYRFSRKDPHGGQTIRKRNGLFATRGRSALNRCGGVIVTEAVLWWNLDAITVELWLNPLVPLKRFSSQWALNKREWECPSGVMKKSCRQPCAAAFLGWE